MKNKTLGLLSLAIAGVLLVSCGKSQKKAESAINSTGIVEVSVMKAELKEIERRISYPVTIQAFKENHLAPATAGRVEKILVEIGDKVNEGQVVVQLDRSNYMSAKIQFNKLALDLQRMDSLYKAGAIARQQYDAVKMQYDVAKTNMEFLRDNTTLKSPIRGEITGKYLNDGEMFTMSPAPGIGKPAIVSIMQLDRLKLLINISYEFMTRVKAGQDVTITADIYPDKVFHGKVAKVYPTVDEMTKTFTAEVYLDNTQRLLKPGMFARASLQLGKDKALLVPAYLVQKQPGTNERFIFIARDGKAVRCTVEPGELYDDMLEIRKGIYKGDLIITSGQTRFQDGAPVHVLGN